MSVSSTFTRTLSPDIADVTKWPYEIDVDGKRYPDYARCVAISTSGALKEKR